MRIFSFEFYSADSLWLHAYRRGTAFEIETTRRDSPTLYGITSRAVASKGGQPGGRWLMRATSPGSQAVTNTAVLTGESPKSRGNVLPARVSDASTIGWRAGGRREARRDFRMAKLHQGFHPEGARWNESFKQATKQSPIHPVNQSRSIRHSLAVPLPASTHLRLMSWNVEGLKETAKYERKQRFCSSNKISLLCA